MKTAEHIAFAKFVANQVYINEMNRRGIQRTVWTELGAQYASSWISEHIGTLPDYLEPGRNIYHRKIFHSKDAYRLIEQWKTEIKSKPSANYQADIFLLMACTAYQSHIVLDSVTPMTVPDYQWIWRLLESFEKK